MKKVIRGAIVALVMIVLVALGILGYLSVDEFKPRPVETQFKTGCRERRGRNAFPRRACPFSSGRY